MLNCVKRKVFNHLQTLLTVYNWFFYFCRMQILKQVFKFYINSSIHVALSVVSLTWITLMDYGILCDKKLLFFVFFASISGYNFVKYSGMVNFHHRSLATWLKVIQVFSFFSFLLMCYFALKLSTIALLFIAGFGMLTFFYAMPFLPKKMFLGNQTNLRNVSGIKVYLIALVWTGVTFFLPLLNNHYHLDMDVFLTAFQRFIFIIILMLPFEIRDLRYDSLKLATIPQKIGVKQTKIMGFSLLTVFLFLEFFKNEIHVVRLLILPIIASTVLLFLMFSKKEQGRYYSSFWVEGLPILWCLLELLVN